MKKKINQILRNPKTHIIFLMCLIFISMIFWKPMVWDDGYYGQMFAEKIVNSGKIDLSIGGFHGADFFVAIVYFFTRSQWAVYITDFIFALLMIPMMYLATKEIFGNERIGVLATYIFALMPFEYFNAVRGGHQIVHWFMAFFAVWLLFKDNKWSWLALGWSFIIRPFSIAFVPFWIYKKKYKELALSFSIPIIYILAQYRQIGRVLLGTHTELTTQSLISVKRFIPNLIYTAQNFLSVHNFSPFSNVYLSDVIRFSPLITFFAILGIFYSRKYFADRKLFWTLAAVVAIGIAIPCSFARMDMCYMIFGYAGVILLALPALVDYERLWPIVAATSAFQFLYFYLAYGHVFKFPYVLFIIPAAVFGVSAGYAIMKLEK